MEFSHIIGNQKVMNDSSKGISAEEAACNGPHFETGNYNKGGSSKSAEALRILGAGRPYPATNY